MKISACVIAKNEAENLPRWLASARVFADEMIVVDTGSTDATAEIARAGGAEVYRFAWTNDFAAAKNFALDRASGDWVVFTDADEYFSEESAPRVRALIEEHDAAEGLDGFIVHLVNIDMETGALLGTTAKVQRIFRRAPWLRFVGSIHEHVENLSGDPAREMMFAQDLTLYHTGYSPQVMRKKSERDLRMLLERRAAGQCDKMDAYHLMDCYYTLEDYEKAAAYAREAMALREQPVGGEERPHTVLLQSLILMGAGDTEIDAAYEAAARRFPQTADFPLIYGTYAWDRDYIAAARRAYAEGVRLHEEYYREGAYSGVLAPLAYERLGTAAELCGEQEAAAAFYIRSLRAKKRHLPALKGLLRLFSETGAAAADVIAALRGLYDEEADAGFLAEALTDTPFPYAALYYEKRSAAKFTPRRRLLLTGEVCAAAASLIEETERAAALAAAYLEAFSPEEQARIALLLPRSCREISAAPEDLRMRRRIGRLAKENT
ncbi:glycosyltransferase family 2 protein [Selenomonas sp. F0473]|uniref:glycosyltransferase family 2 protein n=1 Tax=Selenomonas sp. F0473 TaxID=999423 RepID=UPI00029E1CE3|nr:glycosyltransferase family 2 protein [Selenomonas sp. F0473]EKU71289.1 hypothetical protein HMPREF9161_00995 [Selenomonas sp. F0473]